MSDNQRKVAAAGQKAEADLIKLWATTRGGEVPRARSLARTRKAAEKRMAKELRRITLSATLKKRLEEE